jgi:hypothetical protein
MADHEHQADAAQRLLNLLYLIRVTEKLGEDILPADFIDGYNHAIDDMIDAITCEFGLFDVEWLWEE